MMDASIKAAQDARNVIYKIKHGVILRAEGKATWGEAQDKGMKFANDLGCAVTLLARELPADGRKMDEQSFTVIPTYWEVIA
jgi:hypothetical protein